MACMPGEWLYRPSWATGRGRRGLDESRCSRGLALDYLNYHGQSCRRAGKALNPWSSA